MKILEVLIEYSVSKLDRLFSYVYYLDKPVSRLNRVIVPFNNRKICGVVINIFEIDSLDEYSKSKGINVKEVISVVDDEPLINCELELLADEISSYYFAPKISVFFAMLPPSLKPSVSFQNKPKIAYEQYVKVVGNVSYEGLTSKQSELLFRISSSNGLKKSECSVAVLKSLISKNRVEVYCVEKNRMFFDYVSKKDKLVLNDEQRTCYDEIVNGKDSIYLLEGVTGSGKTEVYLQVVEKIIGDNKTVLMLVPEISLSHLMVKRFKERFSKVAVLHSQLTSAQRYDEYRRIKSGEVDVVIGARSAIFAPLDNIGLVIIDEEHSETYKQEDQMPYYNALDVAKMRQKYHNYKIILGSATPSLESKSRALKGVYKQLFLTKRVNNLPLPNVRVIDMTDRNNITKQSALLSKPLIEALSSRIEKKEQSILIVNRRGYSPYVSCRKCGYVVKCPSCQVALTYHYENDVLECHHCGYEQKMFISCPKCKSNSLFKSGFGTEKVELEVKSIFPSARVLRLDSDVSKKSNMTKQILNSFSNNEADILIGTQIVAKGHDFPNVTFVGVVLADIGLAIPSFRANERTFSLITQAIGRSGRNKEGEAYIQTYMKNHFVIRTASKQDYMSFYANEIYMRKLLQNPPYTYMALLLVMGENEDDVIDAISEVKKYLEMKLDSETVSIIGPSEMFIKKFMNCYRRKIVVKYKDYSKVRIVLEDLKMFFLSKNSIKLVINVDPYEDY